MKKILAIVIMGIVILSGFGSITYASNTTTSTPRSTTQTTTIRFTEPPTLIEKDGFNQIELAGATTQLLEQHKPILPLYVKTFEIPFQSTNIQVICTEKQVNTMTLAEDIIPAMIAPLSKMTQTPTYVTDPSIYDSAQWYPQTWYTYDLGAGRNQMDQQVTFVKVICYPVRYSPVNHLVDYTEGLDVTVSYTPPTTPRTVSTEYDMVIIAPKAFEDTLQPLIDFKNTKGVTTMFKSVEDILAEYNGTDQPEQIKLFIKDAYDTSPGSHGRSARCRHPGSR